MVINLTWSKFQIYLTLKRICIHLNEPDCGVKDAVKSGHIAKSRYESYLNMIDEDI